jgi:hypothetical protein
MSELWEPSALLETARGLVIAATCLHDRCFIKSIKENSRSPFRIDTGATELTKETNEALAVIRCGNLNYAILAAFLRMVAFTRTVTC